MATTEGRNDGVSKKSCRDYRQALAKRIRRTQDAPSIAKIERVDRAAERLIRQELAKLERTGDQIRSSTEQAEAAKKMPAPAPARAWVGQDKANGHQADMSRAKHNAELMTPQAGRRLVGAVNKLHTAKYQKIVLAYERGRELPSHQQPEATRTAAREPGAARQAFTERSQNNARETFRDRSRGGGDQASGDRGLTPRRTR